MATKNTGVRTQHPEYEEWCGIWKRCDDAAEGEHEIHAGGVSYLPKLTGETTDEYNARKNRTPFYNAFWKTISGLKGMLFRKSPVAEFPPGVADYMADVDMAGTSLDLFVQDLAEELLTVGRCGILIDHPMMPTTDGAPITVAQAQDAGLRPMFARYDAADIINWKTARINNAVQLTLVVLRECKSIGTDKYSQDKEDQWRVLELENGVYKQTVWRINQHGEDEQVGTDIFPQMDGKAIWFIPFVFFGVDDVTPCIDSPPLLDLCDMNLHHYQVSADWEHGCHFQGLPTAYISGYSPQIDANGNSQKIGVGGTSVLCLPDPQAKMAYAEVMSSFDALQKNLEAKEKQMAILGARMLEQQKSHVESAQTLQQRTAGEMSQLAAMAKVMSATITRCMQIFCDWAGVSGNVHYQISTDFMSASMTAQDLTALLQALQAGAISQQTFFDNLQRAEIVDPELTFEEEQTRIESQTPPAP